MLGRACLLLQRDFRELMEKGYEGITAFPVSEDMMEWKANIAGLQNSVWQGLAFEVTVSFTPDYNFVPPAVRFVTIPFHPNVDPDTGEPCIDFLNNPDKCNPRYTLIRILLTLPVGADVLCTLTLSVVPAVSVTKVMLSNPVTKNPVNLEAAQMLTEDLSMYRRVLQRLFQGPLQLEDSCPLLPEHSPKLLRPSKANSFDDYHKTRCGLATSQASEYHRRPLLEDPHFPEQYSKWKEMDLPYPEEWKFKFAIARSRFARESRVPSSVSLSGEMNHLCPTPEEHPTESQPELDHVTEAHETEDV